jgi:hypothetical protein
MSQEAIDAAQAAAVALVRTNRRNRKNYDMLRELVDHCLAHGLALPPHIAEWHEGQKLVNESPDLEAIRRQDERVAALRAKYGVG